MKLRLSPQKIVIRVSEAQWQDFKATEILTERFWLSDTKSIVVKMELSERSQYQTFADGFLLKIASADLKTPKSKKDFVWEIPVGDRLTVAIEIDLFSHRNSEREA